MIAHHVIFGYDGSDVADLALRAACKVMNPEGTLTVVHAYEIPWQVDAYPWFEDFKAACEEAADEVLEQARSVCADYPVTAEFKTAVGKPAATLARIASEEQADLIALGSRGLGPIRGAIGSVTFRLLNRANYPVLVIPEPRHESEGKRPHLEKAAGLRRFANGEQ